MTANLMGIDHVAIPKPRCSNGDGKSHEVYTLLAAGSIRFLTKDESIEELLKTIERQQKENEKLREIIRTDVEEKNRKTTARVDADVELNIKPKKCWQL